MDNKRKNELGRIFIFSNKISAEEFEKVNMQELVFPFMKNLHGNKESAYSKYMGDAIFKVPTPLMLDKIVNALDFLLDGETQ